MTYLVVLILIVCVASLGDLCSYVWCPWYVQLVSGCPHSPSYCLAFLRSCHVSSCSSHCLVVVVLTSCCVNSGAELANVINEAALTAVRRNGNTITMADIYDAMDRVLQVRGRLLLHWHLGHSAII